MKKLQLRNQAAAPSLTLVVIVVILVASSSYLRRHRRHIVIVGTSPSSAHRHRRHRPKIPANSKRKTGASFAQALRKLVFEFPYRAVSLY